jgi:hypothetical protein
MIDEKEYDSHVLLIKLEHLTTCLNAVDRKLDRLITEHNSRLINCKSCFTDASDLAKLEKKVDEIEIRTNSKFSTRDKWAMALMSLAVTNLVTVVITLIKIFVYHGA